MLRLFKNLTFWVLVAITAGILVGHYFPELALRQVLDKGYSFRLLGQEMSIKSTFSELLGSGFISVVKLFINPIIFLTITLGIVSMGDLKKVGRVGAKALLYFEVVTTFALIIGVAVALLIQPGNGVDTSAVKGADVSAYTQKGNDFSWWQFLKENSTLQVLLVALVLGVSLSLVKKKDRLVHIMHKASRYVFKGLHRVMLLAPIGAFGGMAYTISKFGIDTLLPLGKLMITVYITMALFIFLVLYFILRMYKVSLIRFLKYIREELLIVLGTSSSEAALPSLMEKLERMGCSKPVVGLVVPTGYSFNLDGTTIYLSMCMIFLGQVFNVELGLGQIAANWIREKHWWPQAEAMVGFFTAWQLSGEDRFLQQTAGVWTFIKRYIRDQQNGEWYWGVTDRLHKMEGQDKAGFWKCPYHNARACMEVGHRIRQLLTLPSSVNLPH